MKKYLPQLALLAAFIPLLFIIYNLNLSSPDPQTNELAVLEIEDEEDKRSLQLERAEYDFKLLRNPLTNTIPKKDVIQSMKAAELVPELDLNRGFTPGLRTLPPITVDERGPSNFGGRTRAFAFDSRNQQIIVAGGVSGGIFRTTNGGDSWTCVTPPGQIHNTTTIVQDQNTKDIWYAAGGEQLGNSASGSGAPYFGNGVWKSTDNGLTWSLLASTSGTVENFDSFFDFVHRILVDPTNGDVYCGNTQGLVRSTDGGANWAPVLVAANAGFTSTIVEIIRAENGIFYSAIAGEGIWNSADGTNWNQIATPSDLVAGGIDLGRIVLASAPSAPDSIYAMYKGPDFTCGGETSDVYLRLYDNNSGTWTGDWDDDISVCTDPMLKLDLQGGYNMAIAVRPNNPDELFIGGERLYRFTVTSASAGTYVFGAGDQGNPSATSMHVDNHQFVFFSDDILWAGTDGGLRFADVSIAPVPHSFDPQGHTNGGFSWTIRNTGFITYQFYRGDITPNTTSTMIGGGAQDNANTLIPGPGTASIGTELGGGDGIQFAIISGTSLTDFNVLTGTQGGTMFRRTNSGTSTFVAPFDSNDPNASYQGFNTYFLLDSDNTDHLYYPTSGFSAFGTSLLRTRLASTMTFQPGGNITGDPSTGYEDMTFLNLPNGDDISALSVSHNASYNDQAYSASDGNRKLYIGTENGKLYRASDPAFGNSAAVDITPGGLMGHISDIAVNPYDDKEIVVTVSNYGVTSIYHTTDASVGVPSYTEIEGAAGTAVALASIRSALITFAGSKKLYIVGTSTGVYGTTTLNGSSTVWEKIGTNIIAFANSVDMRLRVADNKALVASHGNGMFLLNLPCVSMNASVTSASTTTTDMQCPITYYTGADCSGLIAKVEQSGASPISGSVDAKLFIDPTVQTGNTMDGGTNVPYVQRHQEIVPATNAGTATATVTLYYLQSEFDAFNAHPNSTLDLPTGPADAAGKANMRLTKRAGASSNTTGDPGSYTDPARLNYEIV